MRRPRPFKLERYFGDKEHRARFLLSSSDCETMGLGELLGAADPATLAMWEGLRLGYTEPMGHPALRDEVAALYPGLGPGNVLLISPGEGILLAFAALLEAGDHVIVTYPAYQTLFEIPAAMGCSVTLWRLEPGNGRWALDLDFLERSIRSNTKLVVVNFPHNPTGFHPSREEYGRVLDIVRRRGLYLFSDEMYRLLEMEPSERLDPAAGLYERAVSLSGLSKSFGLPGLRIGWLTAGDRGLIEDFSKLRDYTTLCSGAPNEILAIAAMRARETIIGRNRGIIARNLGLARGFFALHEGELGWFPPRAGSVALARLRLPVDVESFCAALFERKGVLLLPGSVFDLEGNYFRLGFGRRDMGEGLAALDEFINENR